MEWGGAAGLWLNLSWDVARGDKPIPDLEPLRVIVEQAEKREANSRGVRWRERISGSPSKALDYWYWCRKKRQGPRVAGSPEVSAARSPTHSPRMPPA